MPKLRPQAFFLPKAGNRPEEYEDAYAMDAEKGLFAMADGASDSFEARLWSRALVDAFIRQPPSPDELLSWLEDPIRTWKEGIQWEGLAWYAVEKARLGAFATLLGVTLTIPEAKDTEGPAPGVCWKALALGDTCLFQIRGEEMVAHFPLERSTEFNTTPPLLSTRLDYTRRSIAELRCAEGQCLPGDYLLLITDALAAWSLGQVEVGANPWQRLISLTQEAFSTFVNHLRAEEGLTNDDVTLVSFGWAKENGE